MKHMFNIISKSLIVCSSLLMTVQVFAQETGGSYGTRLNVPGSNSQTNWLNPPEETSKFNWQRKKKQPYESYFKTEPLPKWTPPPIPRFRPTNFNVGAFSEFCSTPKDDFIKLINKIETATCYQNNKNSDPSSLEGENNLSLIRSDVYTCRCLYEKAESNATLLGISLNKNKKVSIDIAPRGKTYLEVQSNLKAGSVATITGDEVAVARFSGTALLAGGVASLLHLESNVDQIKSDLEEAIAAGTLKQNSPDEPTSTTETEQKPTNQISENYLNSNVSEGHCISGREFVLFKSLPQEDQIFKEFGNKSFNPSDWSYPKLRNRYNEIMGLLPEERAKYKEEISVLKPKIKYLDSNPIIKAIFAVEENLEASEKVISNIPNKEFQVLARNVMTAPNILKSKTELYKILHDYADVRKKCFGKPGECLEQASKNGKTAKLMSDLKAFIGKPDVKFMQSFGDQNQAKVSRENPYSKPENWTREGLLFHFNEKYPSLSSPSSCLKQSGVDTEECSKVFAEYCPVVETAYRDMAPFDMDDILKDDVDLSLTSTFDIKNLEKNEEFKRLNDEICMTPRKVNPSDERAVTFFDFKKEYCEAKPKPHECNSTDGADIQKIRAAYMGKFKHPMSSNALAFNDVSSQVEIKDMKLADVVKKQQTMNNLNDLFDFSHFAGAGLADLKPKRENSFLSSLAEYASDKTKSQNENTNTEVASNYISNFVPNAPQTEVAQETKVENLSDTQRSNLLDDWKQELSQFKKEQSVSSDSNAYKLKEEALNEKIATLEALLAQQKKLTESQYKLLNDAIAAKSRKANDEEIEDSSVAAENQRVAHRKSQNYIQDHGFNEGSARNPASVKDYQMDMGSGAVNGTGPASVGKGRSGSNALSDGGASDSSVERENAKLVSLRQNSNGSITIEAKGSSGTAPNAISVPISDDLYKMAQMNPTGLNLFQIEKSIPKEQIAELEKKEYIILLLQNGKNPPLEVKVRKENNRLVQVKNTQIVTRTFSLEGLQNSLRQ